MKTKRKKNKGSSFLPSFLASSVPWILVVLAILIIVAPPALKAQTDPARTHFAFQMYVDPLNGDDAVANAQNKLPLQYHPSGQINGLLFQAPFPFRTVTSAINWVKTNFKDKNNKFSLPWNRPNTNLYCDFVIIHCAPGLYGPIIGSHGYEIDKYSGLPWNGETFPIMLPDRVCIQGASALNTIFDARCYEDGVQNKSVFSIDPAYQSSDPGDTDSWENTFIDSVTIRGARGGSMEGFETVPPPGGIPPGAGVAIGNFKPPQGVTWPQPLPACLIVSNCFITNNTVGIAINNYYYAGGINHHPLIINNTIAWNAVGIWAGQDCQGTNSNVPIGPNPILLNNILDSGSPTWRHDAFSSYPPLIKGISGFEGLTDLGLLVVSIGNQNLSNPLDFNAYELDYGNKQNRKVILTASWVNANIKKNIATSIGWPNVDVPQTNFNNMKPRVNILPFTWKAGGGRGVLYLNDIFAKATGFPAGFDRSPHDFRLSPYVKTASSSGNPDTWNPLVDWGIDVFGENLPIKMKGSNSAPIGIHVLVKNSSTGCPDLWVPPGVPSGERHPWYQYQVGNTWYTQFWNPRCVSDYATFNPEDQDAEGFGNPRCINHPWIVTPGPGGGSYGVTDIGADELGDLEIGGYVYNTTMFSINPSSRAPTLGVNLINVYWNTEIYFFGQKGQNNARPYYYDFFSNSSWDSTNNPKQPYDWWRFLWRFREYNVGLIPGNELPCPNWTGNYIYYMPGSPKVGTLYVNGEEGANGKSFRASQVLVCGLKPFPGNLVTDISPHLIIDDHPDWGTLKFLDAFACNPWFWDSKSPFYNYDNSTFFYQRDISDITVGVMNPPETWQEANGGYLRRMKKDVNGMPLFFDTSGQGRSTFQVNNWGFGDTSGGYDYVYDTSQDGYARGWRVNCQLPNGWNLQSFLGVNWPYGFAANGAKKPKTGYNTQVPQQYSDPMALIRLGILKKKDNKKK